MHAPRILPLLASILAMLISLFIAILFGPSGIDIIMPAVFDMVSPLQLIIAAEAGAEAERARSVAAAKISIFRMNFLQIFLQPGCWRYRYGAGRGWVCRFRTVAREIKSSKFGTKRSARIRVDQPCDRRVLRNSLVDEAYFSRRGRRARR